MSGEKLSLEILQGFVNESELIALANHGTLSDVQEFLSNRELYFNCDPVGMVLSVCTSNRDHGLEILQHYYRQDSWAEAIFAALLDKNRECIEYLMAQEPTKNPMQHMIGENLLLRINTLKLPGDQMVDLMDWLIAKFPECKCGIGQRVLEHALESGHPQVHRHLLEMSVEEIDYHDTATQRYEAFASLWACGLRSGSWEMVKYMRGKYSIPEALIGSVIGNCITSGNREFVQRVSNYYRFPISQMKGDPLVAFAKCPPTRLGEFEDWVKFLEDNGCSVVVGDLEGYSHDFITYGMFLILARTRHFIDQYIGLGNQYRAKWKMKSLARFAPWEFLAEKCGEEFLLDNAQEFVDIAMRGSNYPLALAIRSRIESE